MDVGDGLRKEESVYLEVQISKTARINHCISGVDPNKEDWEIRSDRVHSNLFGASVSTNLCCWVCLLVAKQMVLTIGDMSHLFFSG